MKILIICLMLIGSSVANAAFIGPNKSPEYKSIQAIKDAPVDNIKIVLRGHIIEKIGHEKYVFKDDTATIPVEIDDRKLAMIDDITPETLVEIHGEVDLKRDKSLEIDVKFIKVVGRK